MSPDVPLTSHAVAPESPLLAEMVPADPVRLGDLLRDFWRDAHSSIAPPDSGDDKEFFAHADTMMLRNGRALAVLLGGLTLAWWPIDYVLFPGRLFETNSIWRVAILLCAAFVFWVVPRSAGLREHVVTTMLGTGALCVASLAYATSRLGGLELPQFEFIHLVTLGVVFVPLPLGRRVAATVSLAVVELLAFFGPNPAYMHHPFFGPTLSMLATTVALSVAIGHVVYALERRNYLQERALVRRSGDLAALNGQLEGRVREKTDDLRRLASRVESLREAERTHVARELHDELGQELAALRFALGLTRRRFERSPASIGANLGELESLLDRTSETTRDVVTELRPRILDDMGLSAAIEWQAHRSGARTQLELTLELRCDDAQLSPAVRIAAFRILQESLTNIERHAAARRVVIRVATENGRLELEVRDDGVGLRGRPAGRGTGLIGMRERVQSLGGQLHVDSPPEGGTSVRVELPVAAQESAS